MSVLVLMIGIPGSGKTTLRSKIRSDVLICPDDLIGYTKENPWTPQVARNAWRESDRALKEALINKEGLIVFDATFVGRKKRSKYIRMAQKYGAEVVALYCRVSFNEAIRRNASREPSRKVPDMVMKGMYGRLEVPEMEEGFKYVLTFDSETSKLDDGILPDCLKVGGLND